MVVVDVNLTIFSLASMDGFLGKYWEAEKGSVWSQESGTQGAGLPVQLLASVRLQW